MTVSVLKFLRRAIVALILLAAIAVRRFRSSRPAAGAGRRQAPRRRR